MQALKLVGIILLSLSCGAGLVALLAFHEYKKLEKLYDNLVKSEARAVSDMIIAMRKVIPELEVIKIANEWGKIYNARFEQPIL